MTGADRSGLAEQHTQTAGIVRLGGDGGPPPCAATGDIALNSGVVRFAAGGNAVCRQACSDLADQRLGPDVGLASALTRARCAGRPAERPARLPLPRRPRGPGQAPRLNRRRRATRGSPARRPSRSIPHSRAATARTARWTPSAARSPRFPAPLGTRPSLPGFEPTACPARLAATGRTHYAFDSFGSDGAVEVIVIDNGAGSLAAADAHQSWERISSPGCARSCRTPRRKACRRSSSAATISTRRCRVATPPTTPTRSPAVLVDEGATSPRRRPLTQRRTAA